MRHPAVSQASQPTLLEAQLQGNLADAGSGRLGHLGEGRRQNSAGRDELRMVEEVEPLSAKLQIEHLRELRILH